MVNHFHNWDCHNHFFIMINIISSSTCLATVIILITLSSSSGNAVKMSGGASVVATAGWSFLPEARSSERPRFGSSADF